ncbi:MAG: hypothetical protein ACK5U4_00390 [Rhodospirillales bacterium]|jgi:hypothetical protein
MRRNVLVHGDERDLITLAKDLAGRDELSIEGFPMKASSRVAHEASCGMCWPLGPKDTRFSLL